MLTILGWVSLALAVYFGTGIAIGAVKSNVKVAKWSIAAFVVAVTLFALLV